MHAGGDRHTGACCRAGGGHAGSSLGPVQRECADACKSAPWRAAFARAGQPGACHRSPAGWPRHCPCGRGRHAQRTAVCVHRCGRHAASCARDRAPHRAPGQHPSRRPAPLHTLPPLAVQRNDHVFASNWIPLWAGLADPGSDMVRRRAPAQRPPPGTRVRSASSTRTRPQSTPPRPLPVHPPACAGDQRRRGAQLLWPAAGGGRGHVAHRVGAAVGLAQRVAPGGLDADRRR